MKEQIFNIEKQIDLVNLLSNFDVALQAVIKIESSYSSEALDKNAQYDLRRNMMEVLATLEEKMAFSEENNAKLTTISGFQGLGGFNRYTVLSDGTIRLSADHSTQSCIKKAHEVGVLVQDFYNPDELEKPCPCGSGKKYGKCHGK